MNSDIALDSKMMRPVGQGLGDESIPQQVVDSGFVGGAFGPESLQGAFKHAAAPSNRNSGRFPLCQDLLQISEKGSSRLRDRLVLIRSGRFRVGVHHLDVCGHASQRRFICLLQVFEVAHGAGEDKENGLHAPGARCASIAFDGISRAMEFRHCSGPVGV